MMAVNDLRLDMHASNQSGWTEDRLMRLHMALLAIIGGEMRLPQTPRLEEKKKVGLRGYFLDSEPLSKVSVKEIFFSIMNI